MKSKVFNTFLVILLADNQKVATNLNISSVDLINVTASFFISYRNHTASKVAEG
ncbi:hypothetical protein AB7179_01045 [Providencia manganoxydans]|uniref:Uncharacterized protein n=1 Tax=Providencia manganoxydans TaxID=2923283 RepID=A0ABX7AIY2_9GAMM|nr:MULTISPECIES: hypothetical protein [Providencia]MDX4945214.1 hypothetical protein [Providencia manganoxydans]QQO63926.1 hypothetical protein JI723_08230 [Providencia manganoxydans]HEF8773271.1 hypothetical protein [Providencia stuartii]